MMAEPSRPAAAVAPIAIAEDEERRAEGVIQEMTDKHVAEIDALSEEKQKEIMEF